MEQVFDEFEAFVESVKDADVQFTLPRLQTPVWRIRHASFGGLHLQSAFEGGGNIAEGSVRSDGCLIFLPLSRIEVRANGSLMEPRHVFVGGPGSDFRLSCDEPHEWFTLFVPNDLLMDRTPGAALPPRSAATIDAGTGLTAKLRKLVLSVDAASRLEPTILTQPASLSALRSELVTTVRDILGRPRPLAPPTSGRPAVERDLILRSALDRIDAHPESAPSLDELVQAADVSERTLRTVFGEFFGVPPARYIRLRRLHATRKALRKIHHEGGSVTAVAARYGFWDLGRFAKEYRQTFGELPSETLRRESGRS